MVFGPIQLGYIDLPGRAKAGGDKGDEGRDLTARGDAGAAGAAHILPNDDHIHRVV